MCRLLLLYNTTHNEKKIRSFLLQSTRKTPFIPHIKYPHVHLNKGRNDDGVGFSYIDTSASAIKERRVWKIYKNPGKRSDDIHLEEKIKEISSHSLIIGELRRKIIGDVSIENTPPYTYHNHVFFHNGVILNYTTHSNKILSMISPKYRKQIQGETDSEHIFYLLLTEIDKLKKKMTEEQVMNICLSHLFELLVREKIHFHMNIIYANHTHIVITRYSHLHKNTRMSYTEPMPLYVDSSDGIVISSEPITSNYVLLSENKIITIPIS
jgi:predicted glutamine amidotransferase